MKPLKNLVLGCLVGLLCAGSTQAQAPKAPVRIGVMSDQSSLYASVDGLSSAIAANMAAEDFGGRTGRNHPPAGRPTSEISTESWGEVRVCRFVNRN